jgi:hypothetical protein
VGSPSRQARLEGREVATHTVMREVRRCITAGVRRCGRLNPVTALAWGAPASSIHFGVLVLSWSLQDFFASAVLTPLLLACSRATQAFIVCFAD